MQQFFEKSEKHLCPVCFEPSIKNEIIRVVIKWYAPSNHYHFKKVMRYKRLNVCGTTLCKTLPKPSDPNSLFTRFSIADEDFVSDVIGTDKYEVETLIKEMAEYGETDKLDILKSLRNSLILEKHTEDNTDFFLFDEFNDEIITFYQSEDGRLIFLDDLNGKMIAENYGADPNKWPNSIEGDLILSNNFTVEQNNRTEMYSFLPIGAEVQFIFIDINKFLSEPIINKYQKRVQIKRKTAQFKNQKKKPKSDHVITKADFQTFVPFDPDEHIMLTKEDFPSLPSAAQPKFKQLAPPSKPKDDFPSFGKEGNELSTASNQQPKKTVGKKGWVMPQPPPPLQGSQAKKKGGNTIIDDFPSLDSTPKPPQRQKKKAPSPWGSLKF